MSEKNRLQEYCQKYDLPLPIYKCWSTGEQHKLQWSASVTLIIGKKNITANTIVPSNSKISAEKQAALMMLDHIKSKGTNSHKISNLSKLRIATEQAIATSHKSLFVNKPAISKKSLSDSESSESTNSESCGSSNSGSETDNKYNDDNNKIIIDISDLNTDNITTVYFDNIYLIDLENKPAFRCNIRNDSLYLGFINTIHHSVGKYNTWHKSSTDDIINEISTSKNNKLLYLIDGGTTDLVDHFMTVFSYPLVRYIQKNHLIHASIYIISGDHAGWCTRACLEKVFEWHKMSGIKIINSVNLT